jgi:hypothetical protein
MIDLEAVPLVAEDVVIRADPAGYMLFHIRTDEMYLAGDAGHMAFSLCDGTRTVREIAEVMVAANPDWGAGARDAIVRLLGDFAERKLVELWG